MASALVTIPIKVNSTGFCPNCKVHAAFVLRESRQIWPRLEIGKHIPDTEARTFVRQFVQECQHCHHNVVTLQVFRREGEELKSVKVGDEQRVWPPAEPRELPDVAPEEVRSLFLEGGRCEAAGAYRAAGGMYRGAVERLCDDRGAAGRNLNERINDLANRGVSQEIVDDLHEARLLGNWSLHDGLEFSAEEVADVAELIAEAVHVLYVEPAERARMRQVSLRGTFGPS